MGNLVGTACGVCNIVLISLGKGVGVRKHTRGGIIAHDQLAVRHVYFAVNEYSACPYSYAVDDNGANTIRGIDDHAACRASAAARGTAFGHARFVNVHHVVRQCRRIVRPILHWDIGCVGSCLRRRERR